MMYTVRAVLFLLLLFRVAVGEDAVVPDVGENPSEEEAGDRSAARAPEHVPPRADGYGDDFASATENNSSVDAASADEGDGKKGTAGESAILRGERTGGASCFSHTNCTDCVAASFWCHWCRNDNTCRARGSIHGCVYGSSCPKDDGGDDDDDDDDDDGSDCASRRNCSDCVSSSSSSSHTCHWCAYDNGCHAAGSPYGCVRSVQCFPHDDGCRRSEPEPIEGAAGFTEMTAVELAVVATAATALLLCLTFCYCCACGVKGAYDDLVYVYSSDRETFAPAADHPSRLRIAPAERRRRGGDGPEVGGDRTALDNESYETVDLDSPLLPPQQTRAEEQQGPPPIPTRRIRSMQRMFNCCSFCYVLAVAVGGASVYGAVRYFPRMPSYNVCDDARAWKAVADAMSGGTKLTADFEILVSISNRNRFDIVLDGGNGTFSHGDAFVGTLEVPPGATIAAASLTDAMLVARFATNKWRELSLTAKFYQGKLALVVDSNLRLRVPRMFNYSFVLETKSMVVRANELSDRTLCACSDWSPSAAAGGGGSEFF